MLPLEPLPFPLPELLAFARLGFLLGLKLNNDFRDGHAGPPPTFLLEKAYGRNEYTLSPRKPLTFVPKVSHSGALSGYTRMRQVRGRPLPLECWLTGRSTPGLRG
jgi:hypothetical protein